jgi:hypothetical protein
MRITIRPMDAKLVHAMTVQAAQNGGQPMSIETLRDLEGVIPSYMALDGDEVLAAAGMVEMWTGRAFAWSTLAPNLGHRMIPIHRAVLRFLNSCEFRRVEMLVAVGHAEGERWAEMLGFEREGRMRAVLPAGGDAWMYARVR